MPALSFARPHGKRPNSGVLAALLAFLIWGGLPIYWKALGSMDALDIVCHRVVWSFLALLPVIVSSGRLGQSLALLSARATALSLAASSLVLSVNWLLFIWAINSNRVLETSLGYFINPLLNILMGMFLFRERIGRIARIAIILAALGVLYQVAVFGSPPWVALGLACAFGLYGLIRKIALVEALPGLFIETLLTLPFALSWLLWQNAHGEGVSLGTDLSFTLLLAGSGIATALPLFLFTFGVRRIRMTTLGLLQYFSPSITFLQGVFLFLEPFTLDSLVVFACIWSALALYTWDSFRAASPKTADKRM